MRKWVTFWLLMLFASASLLRATERKVGEVLEPQMGNYIVLENGLTANFRIEDQVAYLYFLDGEGKLVKPPFARGYLFVERIGGKTDNMRLLMTPEGAAMTSKRKVYKPHKLRFRVVFYDAEGAVDDSASIPIQIYKNPAPEQS